MRPIRFTSLIFMTLLVHSLALSERARGGILYAVTNLGDLANGAGSSFATGINTSGQVVGYSSAGSSKHAFLWSPIVANGKTGSMVDLNYLSGGNGLSEGMGINAFGQVVGYSNFTVVSTIDPTEDHAFLWTPDVAHGSTGSMIDLGNLTTAGGSADAYGINSVGQVVGAGRTGSRTHPVLWTPNVANGTVGTMIDIGSIRGLSTDAGSAYAVNDAGQVVGESSSTSGPLHAFVWTPSTPNGASGTVADLGPMPGGGGTKRTTADDINASGQISGHGETGQYRAMLWTPQTPNGSTGTMQNLGDLPGGADLSWFAKLNARGDVVGGSSVGNGASAFFDHAFLWTSTTGILDLNNFLDASGANWILKDASDINDLGQIVGAGLYDPDGPGPLPAVTEAFLLTPVPEPNISIGVTMIISMLVLIRRTTTQQTQTPALQPVRSAI